jgi:DNA-binding MarR family transcriptional regulator
MGQLSERLSAIDRLVHEPARLVLLTALSACHSADFLFLQRLTGLTPGNLSSHLLKLEEKGLVWIEKKIVGKRTNTRVGLTEKGRVAIQVHWKALELLQQSAEDSVSDEH